MPLVQIQKSQDNPKPSKLENALSFIAPALQVASLAGKLGSNPTGGPSNKFLNYLNNNPDTNPNMLKLNTFWNR